MVYVGLSFMSRQRHVEMRVSTTSKAKKTKFDGIHAVALTPPIGMAAAGRPPRAWIGVPASPRRRNCRFSAEGVTRSRGLSRSGLPERSAGSAAGSTVASRSARELTEVHYC